MTEAIPTDAASPARASGPIGADPSFARDSSRTRPDRTSPAVRHHTAGNVRWCEPTDRMARAEPHRGNAVRGGRMSRSAGCRYHGHHRVACWRMLKEAGGRGFPGSFPFPVAMGDPRFLDTEGWRGTVSECPTDGERRTANGGRRTAGSCSVRRDEHAANTTTSMTPRGHTVWRGRGTGHDDAENGCGGGGGAHPPGHVGRRRRRHGGRGTEGGGGGGVWRARPRGLRGG